MHNIIETFQKILGIKLEFEYVGRESEGGGGFGLVLVS